jgi:hypothetical protein
MPKAGRIAAQDHRPCRSKPRLIDAADNGARLATQRDLVAEGGHGESAEEEGGVGRVAVSEFAPA